MDSNQDVYYSNGTPNGTTNYRIRVIKDLTGTPSLDLITGITSRPTALEVSPHNTASTNLYVGTADGNLIKITNANTTPSVTTLTKPGMGSISDIHFGETENKIYVTYYNYGSSYH